jgi:hypothetical protein
MIIDKYKLLKIANWSDRIRGSNKAKKNVTI